MSLPCGGRIGRSTKGDRRSSPRALLGTSGSRFRRARSSGPPVISSLPTMNSMRGVPGVNAEAHAVLSTQLWSNARRTGVGVRIESLVSGGLPQSIRLPTPRGLGRPRGLVGTPPPTHDRRCRAAVTPCIVCRPPLTVSPLRCESGTEARKPSAVLKPSIGKSPAAQLRAV